MSKTVAVLELLYPKGIPVEKYESVVMLVALAQHAEVPRARRAQQDTAEYVAEADEGPQVKRPRSWGPTLTVAETAKRLGVSQSRVSQLIRAKQLNARMRNNRYRVLEADVARRLGNSSNETLTPRQAAAMAEVSLSTIHAAIKQGEMAKLSGGGSRGSRIQLSREAVEQFIQDRKAS